MSISPVLVYSTEGVRKFLDLELVAKADDPHLDLIRMFFRASSCSTIVQEAI